LEGDTGTIDGSGEGADGFTVNGAGIRVGTMILGEPTGFDKGSKDGVVERTTTGRAVTVGFKAGDSNGALLGINVENTVGASDGLVKGVAGEIMVGCCEVIIEGHTTDGFDVDDGFTLGLLLLVGISDGLKDAGTDDGLMVVGSTIGVKEGDDGMVEEEIGEIKCCCMVGTVVAGDDDVMMGMSLGLLVAVGVIMEGLPVEEKDGGTDERMLELNEGVTVGFADGTLLG